MFICKGFLGTLAVYFQSICISLLMDLCGLLLKVPFLDYYLFYVYLINNGFALFVRF